MENMVTKRSFPEDKHRVLDDVKEINLQVKWDVCEIVSNNLRSEME